MGVYKDAEIDAMTVREYSASMTRLVESHGIILDCDMQLRHAYDTATGDTTEPLPDHIMSYLYDCLADIADELGFELSADHEVKMCTLYSFFVVESEHFKRILGNGWRDARGNLCNSAHTSSGEVLLPHECIICKGIYDGKQQYLALDLCQILEPGVDVAWVTLDKELHRIRQSLMDEFYSDTGDLL